MIKVIINKAINTYNPIWFVPVQHHAKILSKLKAPCGVLTISRIHAQRHMAMAVKKKPTSKHGSKLHDLKFQKLYAFHWRKEMG